MGIWSGGACVPERVIARAEAMALTFTMLIGTALTVCIA
jgi:hypothetical protein